MSINLGIDIGTYSIKVAISKNNKTAEMLLDETDSDKILNIISFNETREIGNVSGKVHIENSITSVNKYILSKRNKNLKHFCDSYKEIEKSRNEFNFTMNFNGEKIIFQLEQILAMIFSKIKSMVKENILKMKVFISVPDNFGMKEKSIIIDSCKIADIINYNLLKKSTGLTSHFITQKNENIKEIMKKNYIFVDFGYSSLTIYYVSILNYVAKCIYSKTLDIGISNIDNNLMDHYLNLIYSKTNKNFLKKNKQYFKILSTIQKKRKELSANKEVYVNFGHVEEKFDFEDKLTRVNFEKIISNIINKINIFLMQSKFKAESKNFNFNNLSEIQKVGGGSRIPFFDSCLSNAFKNIPIKKNMDFLDGLAKGNASNKIVSEKFELIEKLNHDIIISAYNKKTNKIISDKLLEKGTDYQMRVQYGLKSGDNLEIRIFSSYENKEIDLIVFRLDCPYSQDIYFKLDRNGIISIEDLERHQDNSLIVFYKSYYGLDEFEISKLKDIERDFVKKDSNNKENEKLKYDLESYIYSIKKDIEDDDEFLEESDKINLNNQIKLLEESFEKGDLDQNFLQNQKHKLNKMLQVFNSRKNKMNLFRNLSKSIPDYLNYLQNFDMNYSELLEKTGDSEYSKISKTKLKCLNKLKKFKKLNDNFHISLLDSIDVKNSTNVILSGIKYLKDEIIDLSSRQ